MSAIHLRPATQPDAEAVRACVTAAFEHYIPRIGKPPGPMLQDFEAQVAAGHVWIALVDDDAKPAGIIIQYENGGGFYIDTVAVVPHYQGTGVGKALLQFAEQEAIQRGFDSVWLVTNAKMTENQVLYPKIGYAEFDRRVDEGYDRVFYRKKLGAR